MYRRGEVGESFCCVPFLPGLLRLDARHIVILQVDFLQSHGSVATEPAIS